MPRSPSGLAEDATRTSREAEIIRNRRRSEQLLCCSQKQPKSNTARNHPRRGGGRRGQHILQLRSMKWIHSSESQRANKLCSDSHKTFELARELAELRFECEAAYRDGPAWSEGVAGHTHGTTTNGAGSFHRPLPDLRSADIVGSLAEF